MMKKQFKPIFLVVCLIIYNTLTPFSMAYHSQNHDECNDHDDQVCIVCIELSNRQNFIPECDLEISLKSDLLYIDIPNFKTNYIPHKTLLELETMLCE